MLQDICRITPNAPSAGFSQGCFIVASAANTDERNTGAAAGFSVVRFVAKHYTGSGTALQLLYRRQDDVRIRLGGIRVVRGRGFIDLLSEIGARALHYRVNKLHVARRSYRYSYFTTPKFVQQLARPGKDRECRVAGRFEKCLAMCFAKRVPVSLLPLISNDGGYEFVTPLPHFGNNAFSGYVVAMLSERGVPSVDVGAVGIDECPVEVKNDGLGFHARLNGSLLGVDFALREFASAGTVLWWN